MPFVSQYSLAPWLALGPVALRCSCSFTHGSALRLDAALMAAVMRTGMKMRAGSAHTDSEID